jgi:NAD(P)-dependent dehydrogenase (short-subunit alcohol dehydrogenase family)
MEVHVTTPDIETAPLRLSGKVAVVTGAAAGIGRSICQRFAAEGARVVCADVDEEGARATMRSIGEMAVAVSCDVADPAAAERTIRAAVEHFGALHVLVNNAAVFVPESTVESVTVEDWNRNLAVNLTGPMLMSKYAVPAMRRNGGSIIHMASQLGHAARAGRASYCMAKAGLIQLAKAMAIDHAADGIRVNTLSPGPVGTDRVVANYGGANAHAARVGPLIVLGRPGRPDEIARAAVFLACDDSSFVTGTDLLVDGGYTAW